MKNKVLFTFVAILFLSAISSFHALSAPFAVYCQDNTTLYFLWANQAPNVGETYDNQIVTKTWSLPTVDSSFDGCVGAENATRVVINETFINFRPVSCLNWFSGLSNLTEIEGIEYIQTGNVTSMNQMFKDCASLTSLDLSSFDMSKVTNVAGMFQGCSSLTSLDLSDFEATRVSIFLNMFNGCSTLISVDLRNIKPVTTVSYTNTMFNNCNSLRFVNLSNLSDNTVFRSIVDGIPGTPLIFAHEDVYYNRANVVLGSWCGNLVIDNTEADYHQFLLNIPSAFNADKVTIKRNFTSGKPYTLCMPFAIDAQKYGTFYTGGELNADRSYVSFSELESAQTEANQPYLFIPKEDFAEGITMTGPISISPTEITTEKVGLNGVYEKKVFTAEEAAQMVYYGWTGGDFRRAMEGATVDAGRAYFKLPASAAANAPARLNVKFDDKGSSGLTVIKGDPNEDWSPAYNLSGQRIGKNYKGIVIKNHQKTLSR